MLISLMGCFNVFAPEEKYPPLPSGEHYTEGDFKPYELKMVGEYPPKILKLNDKELEDEIKTAYLEFDSNSAVFTPSQLTIDYYGMMSDGSILVYFHGPFVQNTITNYRVIGKYVYRTAAATNEVYLYKNKKIYRIVYAYQVGTISDEVLDEIAETLCFWMFVDPNTGEIPTSPDITDSGSTDKQTVIGITKPAPTEPTTTIPSVTEPSEEATTKVTEPATTQTTTVQPTTEPSEKETKATKATKPTAKETQPVTKSTVKSTTKPQSTTVKQTVKPTVKPTKPTTKPTVKPTVPTTQPTVKPTQPQRPVIPYHPNRNANPDSARNYRGTGDSASWDSASADSAREIDVPTGFDNTAVMIILIVIIVAVAVIYVMRFNETAGQKQKQDKYKFKHLKSAKK